MSALRTIIAKPLRRTFAPISAVRPLSITSTLLSKTPPPPSNIPPSSRSVGRTSSVADDPQSSASTKKSAEHNTGDDHPAKQPDPQPEGDRSTGFNKVEGGVKGGKEGLDQRSDR